MQHYGEDLAVIHAAGFTAIASAAAAELLPRLAPGSRVLEPRVHRASPSARAEGELRGRFVRRRRVPADRDAVLAVGEVLGYIDPTSGRAADLDRLHVRIARALRVGGNEALGVRRVLSGLDCRGGGGGEQIAKLSRARRSAMIIE